MQLKRWYVSCGCGHCRGGIVVMDEIWRRLCVSMSWAWVRRMRRGNISSKMLMCNGGVRSVCMHVYGACLFLCPL